MKISHIQPKKLQTLCLVCKVLKECDFRDKLIKLYIFRTTEGHGEKLLCSLKHKV